MIDLFGRMYEEEVVTRKIRERMRETTLPIALSVNSVLVNVHRLETYVD